MIRPDTGILTNIGSAHDQGFTDRSDKLREKLLLFTDAKSVVAPAKIKNIIADSGSLNSTKVYGWGTEEADFTIKKITKGNAETEIQLERGSTIFDFRIPFTDEASVEGALSCLCAIDTAGFYSPEILESFAGLHPVSMRLEIRVGHNRCVIINDSYSNDLQSLSVAIDFLKQQNISKTTVILSDLLQSGLPPDELYGQVAALMREKEIDRFFGIGEQMKIHRNYSRE